MSALREWLLHLPVRGWQAMFWLLWLCATAVMLLPAPELPSVNMSDKLQHTITFAVLATLAWLGYRQHSSMLAIALSLVAYGVAIECTQSLIPSRSFSVLDMLANTAGVALAAAGCRILRGAA